MVQTETPEGVMAADMFVQAAHIATPSDMGDIDNEQDKDPGDMDNKQVDESDGTQAKDEEHVKFEIYKNDYYIQGSESEGLFALTEVPATELRVQEPSNKVCMHKVQIMAVKDDMDWLVLPA
ncbi:hypothetical protein C0989_000258 [Termitomyces sp. Mn162]|nr:hypothetical protein C0989_000258 [Termitomyces sp. Mn162]